MKILCGLYPHGEFEGEIAFAGDQIQAQTIRDTERRGIVIIHQELALVRQLTVMENIFLGAELGRFGIVDDETMTLRCQQLLARVRLDVSPDARVGDLGLGQQQLVEIARALNKQVRLLILDEPTSSLTERETEVLLSIINNLRDHGIACIYISHKLNEVKAIGIAGLVGAGRTETVQCLFGVWPGRWQGDIWINDKKVQIRDCQQAIAQGIAMVPEDRKKDGIVPLMGVGKNITLAALDQFSRRFAPLDETREQHVINDAIARLRVKTSSPELPIGRLSGGNQQKAIIAKCLLLNPQILILDEPTRGIDVGARQEIYQLINSLVQQGIAVIVISSELPEVLGLSDRVLVMHEGRIKADLINNNLTQEQVMEAALRSEHYA